MRFLELRRSYVETLIRKKKKETQIHPALNQNGIDIQSKNMISLVATFDTAKLQFKYRENANLCNVIAGRFFEDIVKRDVLCIHVKKNTTLKIIH